MKKELTTLSEKIKNLADRRDILKLEKTAAAKEQKYERAAEARNKLKELDVEAIEFLIKEANYDLTDPNQMVQDIWMLFDLVEPGETTFDNALKRIDAPNLQRMSLIKKIEEYKSGAITLDAIHHEIKKSFQVIKTELKDKMTKQILDATQYPYVIESDKLDEFQAIIRDADLTQVFESNWIYQNIFGLSKELNVTPMEFMKGQRKFLESVKFNTVYGEQLMKKKWSQVMKEFELLEKILK